MEQKKSHDEIVRSRINVLSCDIIDKFSVDKCLVFLNSRNFKA